MKRIMMILLTTALALILLGGCGTSKNSGGGNSDKGKAKLDKFVMAYLPIEGAEGVQKTNKEFEKELSEIIGVPVEAFQATSYNAAIEAMKNKKADMVIMPPFAYILGAERANIEVIAGVKPAKGVQSYIVVSKDSDIQKLEDLKGKTFGFVEPSSSSGHLIPKTMLVKELGITVEELEKDFFKDVQFAGNQEAVVIGAVNGQYDAAAVASPIPGALAERGVIKEDSYRVIAESEETPPVPVTIRSEIPDEIKVKIKDFLINYDQGPLFLENLLGMKEASFTEVTDSNYDFYRDISEFLGMSPEELMK